MTIAQQVEHMERANKAFSEAVMKISRADSALCGNAADYATHSDFSDLRAAIKEARTAYMMQFGWTREDIDAINAA